MAVYNPMEIPIIDVEEQIAKGVDDDVKSWCAARAIDVALPWEAGPEGSHYFGDEINRMLEEKYPDSVTSELLGEGSWYELNIKAQQERRETIFRGLGGITTLDLMETADTPYNLDYFRKQTLNDEGQPRVRSAWNTPRPIPQEYLEMFNITPPSDNEVALHVGKTACFYDHGEYFYPIFQFGYYEGDSPPFYIDAVERLLGMSGKYPSESAMVRWSSSLQSTNMPLHEFIREENFDPDKLWDIFWQGLGYNSRGIFGGPSPLSNDDGRPRTHESE